MTWTLAPQNQQGSTVVLGVGINRSTLPATPGLNYAGMLRFTDSLGFTEVDIPVSAQSANYAGLWLGNAVFSQVASYLKTYQTNADGSMAQNTNGAFVVSSINTNLGPVASSATYPIRLILHNDGTNVNLLQRVFYGSDVNSNTIVATAETALDPAQLGSARRISAVHFPWTPTNQPWLFTGQLGPAGALSTATTIPYDDQANNPFLHTYHPDHDNLDATFQNQQPIGVESYQIDRQISLTIGAPGDDYLSLTQFGQSFSGAYAETWTLTGIGFATRTFNVAGSFTINRISPIPVLTRR